VPRRDYYNIRLETEDASYKAVVQRPLPHLGFRFVSFWNWGRTLPLPLSDIEREYALHLGVSKLPPIRSKRAARRRAKQYLRIYLKMFRSQSPI
jgi:hypothetical protein